jgi:hypothetical protein
VRTRSEAGAELKAKGGKFERTEDWGVFIVTDGLLTTGQNPASSSAAAERLLEKVRQKIVLIRKSQGSPRPRQFERTSSDREAARGILRAFPVSMHAPVESSLPRRVQDGAETRHRK